MKLSQSNVIFFCLFAAFVVFITLRGELPKYLDVLFTTKAGGETHSAGASGGSGSGTGIPGIGGLGNAIESLTGDSVLGRAATSLRGALGSIGSAAGALGGIFQ